MWFRKLYKCLAVAMSITCYFTANAQITTSEVTVESTNDVTTVSGALDVDGGVQIFNRTSGHGLIGLNTLNNNKYAYMNLGPGTGYGFQIGKDIDNGAVGGSNNFYIYDLLNNKPRFVIDDLTGNVGIGTKNPITTLDVDGGVQIFNRTSGHGIFSLNTLDNNKYAYMNLGPGTGYGFQIGKDIDNGAVGGSNNFYIYDLLNNTPRFVIDDLTGNVGLGTTNPLGRLHVLNQTGGYEPSNYLVIEGTITDNNNYPGLRLRGGTLISNDAYPYVASTNGGLGLNLSGGYHDTYNQRMNIYLSSNLAGQSNISWYRNSTLLMYLDGNSGNLGIGTSGAPADKLHVNGNIRANGPLAWPDFVFEDDYVLPTLEQVEKDIARERHLPGIPSAEEVAKEGVNLTDMDAKLLQKIEELTLYLIEQNKQIEAQQNRIEQLEKKVSGME